MNLLENLSRIEKIHKIRQANIITQLCIALICYTLFIINIVFNPLTYVRFPVTIILFIIIMVFAYLPASKKYPWSKPINY